MLNKATWIFLLVISGLSFACENKKEANLFKAKNCINHATAATVDSCLDFISNDTSNSAQVVRCSAAFIGEGIDDDAIIEAMRNIKGDKAGDPTAPTIAALAMSSPAASREALEVCTLTESDSLIALANFANLSTNMMPLLTTTPPYTADEIAAAIDAYAGGGTQAEKEALGNAVINGQESLCDSEDGMFKDSPACDDINSAISGNPGNAAAVATALIDKLKN